MVSKKHQARAAPKTSAAASLSVSAPSGPHASTVLKGAFAPSIFQLSLFASVIQALDGQQLQIHDIQSNTLLCQHRVPKTRITTLDWGYHPTLVPQAREESPRKRKRVVEDLNGVRADAKEIVVGFGTDHSDISFYSPTTSRVASSLKRFHTAGIKEFRFHDYGRSDEAWSLGGDKNLVQWSLSQGVPLRTVGVPLSPPSTILALPHHVLVASQDTYLVDLDNGNQIQKLGHGTHPVHTLLANAALDASEDFDSYIAISESDPQALVHGVLSAGKNISALNASAEILQAALSSTGASLPNGVNGQVYGEQVLAIITKDNTVEIFANPFNLSTSRGKDADAKTKPAVLSQRPRATIRISHPGEHAKPLPISGATFEDNDLVIAYTDGPGLLAFERVQWRENSTNPLALHGEILRRKAPSLSGVQNGAMLDQNDHKHSKVDESRAVIARDADMAEDAMEVSHQEPITISSAEEESDSDMDEDMDIPQPALPNGSSTNHKRMGQLPREENADETGMGDEPSFGDLVAANASKVVDVSEYMDGEKEQGMVPYDKSDGKIASGMSLGTVLTQALRANDKSLLESCLHEQDLHIVRATIERLDSTLAVALLQRLAEKLHSRPGRSGGLMVWVQWTLVSHGGYLASQPDLAKKLAALQRVVKARADSLQPLLSLKGKLDMLEAQMNLRRSMQNRSATGIATNENDEDAVVYVEGQSDSDSAGDTDQEDAESEAESESLAEEDSVADVDMDSDDPDASESDENRGLIDDEAAESDGSEDDLDEEVDYEDVESMDEASEEDAPKPERLARSTMANGVQKS